MATIESLLGRAHRTRWTSLVIVVLRLLLGFALLPAGLKKVLHQPFTDAASTGRFHDFLDAFHATGGFYQFVGVVQLTAAVLLLTQRFALLGAVVAMPVVTAIMVFCWSTAVYPTAVVVTLMTLGLAALLLWDWPRWRGVLAAQTVPAPGGAEPALRAPIDLGLWARCGGAILLLYVGACLVTGEVYRPRRGFEPDEPAFYALMAIPWLPVITGLVERARRRRHAR